jgi:hypothetical protein
MVTVTALALISARFGRFAISSATLLIAIAWFKFGFFVAAPHTPRHTL